MHKLILIASLILSSTSFGDSHSDLPGSWLTQLRACSKISTQCKKDKKKLIQKLEELIHSNEELKKQLQNITETTPEIKLDSVSVTVDKDGRVFTKDAIEGTLHIGTLSYDILVKLKTTIVKAKEPQWGLKLKYKAVMLWNPEYNPQGLKFPSSIGLGVEPFYYKNYSVNLIATTSLYGAALGYDITSHFNAIAGLGFLYNKENTIFLGGAFDF